MKKTILYTFLVVTVVASSCSFLANSLLYPNRQPIIKNPLDYGMRYFDIEFLSPDSVLIKGWMIPGEGDKMIIFTHPMNFTRYGYSIDHQKPFKITKLEVEFIKVVRQLHDEGYHVLMFDFRNHGESGTSSNNGITGVGINEWQDVVGAVKYIKSQTNLQHMDVGIVANCMGANSSIIALSKAPEEMEHIKCLVAIQPISSDVFVENFLYNEYRYLYCLRSGIEKKCIKKGGYPFETMTPEDHIEDLSIPVLYVQTANDDWTDTSQVHNLHNMTNSEKELFWIEGDLERFDGYNYFGSEPEVMLEFLEKYME